MKKHKVVFFLILLAINLGAIYLFELPLTVKMALTIHGFLFLVFFLTTLIQNKILKRKKPLPLLSLGVNFLRIILCVIFLLPNILNNKSVEKSYIYNFFFVYLFALFFEILLRRKKIKK